MKLRYQIATALLVGTVCLPAVADNSRNRNDRNHMPPGRAQNNAPPPGKWLQQHLNDNPQDQQRQLRNDPDFKRLAPDQQEHLQQRLKQFNSLPPQQRERIINRMLKMESLPPDRQQTLRNSLQQFRQLPDDRRREVRRAWNSLSQMPPEQQQQVMNSDRFRSSFNDQERSTLKGLLDSGFNPAENNGGPPR
jgi:hypothetical protein